MSDNLLHQHLYVHQSLQHWHRPGGLFGLTSHLFLFSYVMRCWHFRTEKCHQRKPHFMYRINRVDPQGSMNCNISHVDISTYNKIKYNTIKWDGGGGVTTVTMIHPSGGYHEYPSGQFTVSPFQFLVVLIPLGAKGDLWSVWRRHPGQTTEDKLLSIHL